MMFKLSVNVRSWAAASPQASPGCSLGKKTTPFACRLLPLHTVGTRVGSTGSCLGAIFLRRKPTQKSRDGERLLLPWLKPLDPARPEVPGLCYSKSQ